MPVGQVMRVLLAFVEDLVSIYVQWGLRHPGGWQGWFIERLKKLFGICPVLLQSALIKREAHGRQRGVFKIAYIIIYIAHIHCCTQTRL